MTEERSRPKRVKLNEGDIFEFAVPDGRLGYGIIIRRGALKNGGTPYIAIFRSLHDARPEPEQVAHDHVVLAGWTMDSFFYHGRWNVIAHCSQPPTIPFPNFKVEQGGKFYVTDVDGAFIGEASSAELEILDFQFSRAPIGFQGAFESIHDLRPWQESYDKLTPAYSEMRITRSAR